jgi:hypothetical protein
VDGLPERMDHAAVLGAVKARPLGERAACFACRPVAAGNLALSVIEGTRTQGDAGRLWGGFLSLLSFAAALIFV